MSEPTVSNELLLYREQELTPVRQALACGLDPWHAMAAEVFHVEELTTEQRDRAKLYSYKVLYSSDPYFWF